jgi:hypothetical protein
LPVVGVNIKHGFRVSLPYRAGLRGFSATFAAALMAWSRAYASPFSRALLDTSRSYAAVSSGDRLKWSMAMQQNVKSALLRFLPRLSASSRQRS